MATQKERLLAAGTVALIAEPALAFAHTGGVGAIMGLVIAGAAYLGVDEFEAATGREIALPARAPSPDAEKPAKRSLGYRLLNGKTAREEDAEREAERESEEMARDWEDLARRGRDDEENDALPPPPTQRSGKFLFSSVLDQFTPTLDRIYLGNTMDGLEIFCAAEHLCHVALGGATDGGKSSIMRMLMAQLCKAGAQVLLLNPHYTRYDLKKKEDWTPFEPYLMYDPMECRKYEVIEHYLKYTAETLLPLRLEKYAHSQPTGKPYFLVMDELPSIIKHIPKAPEWLGELLREGRKVGIFLVAASQDFLVKTIAPDGSGGAVRDCYRTAYYVGGDGTTANKLLDMPAKDIAEDQMGQGTVMLRCAKSPEAKKAVMARVPYVDNEALYRLLGPSTYHPTDAEPDTDELPALPDVTTVTVTAPQPFLSSQERAMDAVTRNGYGRNDEQPQAAPEAAVSPQIAPLRPEEWDEEKEDTLVLLYRMNTNIDKCLTGLNLSTSQRNRDYARDLLKREGLR